MTDAHSLTAKRTQVAAPPGCSRQHHTPLDGLLTSRRAFCSVES